jgi:predicted exporter
METDLRTVESPAHPRWFDWLVDMQRRRAYHVLGVVGVLTILAIAVATRLQLLTGFENLLPESRASVQELHRVAARTSGVSTIFVVLEGSDMEGLRRAGDALVPALKGLGPPWVGEAEDDVRDVIQFLEPRAGLYEERRDLEQLRDDVQARFDYEVSHELGTNLDDDAPPAITSELVERRLHLDRKENDGDRFPGGYYQSRDGKTLVVAVRSGVLASDTGQGGQALAKVRAVVERVRPASFDPTCRWGLTGDLAIGVGEYNAINRDLTDVGVAGAVMIIGVVLLFYLRLRTVLAMTLTIGVGLAWTFALTEITLGHLNMATGFLFTIVGGNGINFGILFMARYLEEQRGGASAGDAIVVAHLATWRPTLTAAAAAAGSYGSLLITEFKGFREFGIIGGAGMLVCWAATYLTLPALLVVMDRIAPMERPRGGLFGKILHATREGIPFGRPFEIAVARAPRLIAVTSLVLAVAGAIVAARYAGTDPMEYDLRKVQSDQRAVAEEQRLIKPAKEITGYIGLDGMAILVDRVEQVAPLKAALERRRDDAPEGQKPFKDVHALQDFIPTDQAAKLGVLADLKAQVLRARRRHMVDDATWKKIERFLPPADLHTFGLADLPGGLARSFTERDGTRGRILYISPTNDEVTNDAHYLFRWADSFRRTDLPDGSVVLGSGRAVIYADMWAAIVSDVPKAVVLSFGATLLVVVASFRVRRSAAMVVFALLVGVAWMTGALALLGAKLNFLNFMALPITFGIGVDYAVNVTHRHLQLGDPLLAVRRTGGAVILCSMTTLLGYLALVRSVNFAVRSLGVAAVLGEVTCLLAAVLALPAALLWASAKPAPAEAPAPSLEGP